MTTNRTTPLSNPRLETDTAAEQGGISGIGLSDLILAVATALLGSSVYLSGYGGDWPLNSDGVISYVLFDDLFKYGGSARSWIYPVAPYWFPDMLLAWVVYALSHDVFHAVFLYALVQSTLFLLLVRRLYLLVDRSAGRMLWLLWLALWAGLTAYGSGVADGWYASFYRYLFYPTIHGGTLVVTVAALDVLFGLMTGWTQRNLVVLGLLSFVALISDQLYAIWFLLPAVVAMSLSRSAGWQRRCTVIAMMGSSFVAYEIARAIVGGPFFGGDWHKLKMAAAPIAVLGSNFRALLETDIACSLCEGAFCIALAYLLVTSLRRRKVEPRDGIRCDLAIFLVSAIVFPILASIVMRRHNDLVAFRYCQTLALANIALPMVMRPVLVRYQRMAAILLPIMIVGGLVIVNLRDGVMDRGLIRIRDVHAAQIACERRWIKQYHVQVGFAEYWHAMSAMARISDVVIFPLDSSMGIPHSQVNMDLDWLSPKGRGEVEFVDESALDVARLDAILGQPDEKLACPEAAIRLYRKKRGEEGPLSKFYEQYPERTAGQRFLMTGRVDVPAASWSTGPGVPDGDALAIDGEFESRTVAMSAEIELSEISGMWIDYASEGVETGSELIFALIELDDSGQPVRGLASGALLLDRGDHHQLLASLNAFSPRPSHIGFRLIAAGRINASIKTVELSR